MGITGRYALVTGAASGMGFATAMLLASNGASVACCDINDCSEVVAAIESLPKPCGECKSFTFDASCPESIKKLASNVLEWTKGKLDILINNAGISGMVPLTSDDVVFERAWERNFAVNVTAQQRLSRAVLSALITSKSSGRIINVASTEGQGATVFNSPYVSSKHASVGLSKAMAVELASQGVTVNCVCPGPIRTGMTAGVQEKKKELFAKRLVPMRRYGHPEEVAYLILLLVDDRATYVNGAVINVDGGLVANNALLPMRLPWERKNARENKYPDESKL